MKSLIILIIICLFLAGCNKDSSTGPGSNDPPDELPDDPPEDIYDDGSDLSIRYIQRLPEIDYVWNSSDPAVEGWPAVGQEVIWKTIVVNWASHQRDSVTYSWFLDGIEVDHGAIDIPAGGEISIELTWNWTFERHELTFIIDPMDNFEEEEEQNNELTIFTDAITAGFYIEQSVYDYYKGHYSLNGIETFDDWLHKRINILNDMFADAVYGTSPNGVLDRIRIDKITIVSDGALPLVYSNEIPAEDYSAGTHPNLADLSVDLQWGFTAGEVSNNLKKTYMNGNNIFDIDGATLLHELGHARYLTDVYAFRVWHGIYSDSVLIKENGELVAGSSFMPGSSMLYTSPLGTVVGLLLYTTDIEGLMNHTYSFVDSHSAAALNLIAGHRAVCGNYNEPCNIGCYLNDLPSENRLTLCARDGTILANADVKIFQAEGVPGAGYFYARRIDGIADLQFTANDNGQVLLGHNPFSGGQIQQDWDVSNATAVIRVEYEGKVGYNFLDVSKFNLAYWAGHTELADYEMKFKLVEL
ncbi:hypothetical protein ACFLTH_10885 [Bacteroidota bacterium]